MSRLEELIAALCPDGVEYKTLGEICIFQKGQPITVTSLSSGSYPVIAGGQKPAFYCSKYNRTGENITVSSSGAYAGYINYWNEPILCTDSFSITSSKNFNIKMLFYILQSKQNYIFSLKKGGGVPHVYAKDMAKIKIPVPPLPVQEEIVRILDKFMELTAELTAELDTRKQQYQYYRNNLLDFSKSRKRKSKKIEALISSLCPNGIEFEQVGELCQVITAPKKLNKKEYKNRGLFPIIDQGQQFIVGYTNDATATIKKNTYVIFGDHTREIKFVDFEFCQGADGIKILLANNDIRPRFLYYAMLGLKITNRGYNRHWSIVSTMLLPVPPLPIQEEIVRLLDRFDALCNDPISGLPAEIEARKKQYEYYRDKLLTFKEKEAD